MNSVCPAHLSVSAENHVFSQISFQFLIKWRAFAVRIQKKKNVVTLRCMWKNVLRCVFYQYYGNLDVLKFISISQMNNIMLTEKYIVHRIYHSFTGIHKSRRNRRQEQLNSWSLRTIIAWSGFSDMICALK